MPILGSIFPLQHKSSCVVLLPIINVHFLKSLSTQEALEYRNNHYFTSLNFDSVFMGRAILMQSLWP